MCSIQPEEPFWPAGVANISFTASDPNLKVSMIANMTVRQFNMHKPGSVKLTINVPAICIKQLANVSFLE
jgi:hypothetical protein